jgi:ATP-binding cassette, subfamily B, bacterial
MNLSRDTGMPSVAFFVRRMIAYQPLRFAIVALCWISFHTWALLPGLLAKAFFDTLEGRAPLGLNLPSVIALVLAAGLAKVGIIFTTTLAGRTYGFRLQGLLQRNLLAHILERPGAKAVPVPVGEAISTFRDDVDGMKLMLDWVFDAVAGVIFVGVGVGILLWVDARITLLVFIPIVIMIVITYVLRARFERVREESRAATAQVAGSIGEIFNAVQAIQVADAQDSVVAHIRAQGHQRQRAMLNDRLFGLTLEAIFASTANLGAGLTLLVAASAIRAGTFTIGDFALFATYLMQVAEYTGFFGYLITAYRQSGVAFRRGLALLQGAQPTELVAHHPVYIDEPFPALQQPARTAEDRLHSFEVIGLTLRYPGSDRGIEDISLSLSRGSFTVITGRIGSGKTTLLRALLGLLEPQSGEIRWNGRPIADPARFLIPPRVAYTAQAPTLLSGTLRDNILLGLAGDDQRLAGAVHRAVLDRDVALFPDGLDTVIGTRGVRLSGGQIQRAAAARMFIREPELLVVDDLSSALDVETEHRLWQQVFDLGTTCLVVSHRPAVLERADQILVLEHGRVTARGKLKELLASSGEMQRLYLNELA